jgi:hypothetical protein
MVAKGFVLAVVVITSTTGEGEITKECKEDVLV